MTKGMDADRDDDAIYFGHIHCSDLHCIKLLEALIIICNIIVCIACASNDGRS